MKTPIESIPDKSKVILPAIDHYGNGIEVPALFFQDPNCSFVAIIDEEVAKIANTCWEISESERTGYAIPAKYTWGMFNIPSKLEVITKNKTMKPKQPKKTTKPTKPAKKPTKKERQAEIERLFDELYTNNERANPDYEETERIALEIINLEPDDIIDRIDAYTFLSIALTELGESYDALDVSKKALELAPDNAMCHYNVAASLDDIDEEDPEITTYLTKAFGLDPTILDGIPDEDTQTWKDLCAKVRDGGKKTVKKPGKKPTKKEQAKIKSLLAKLEKIDTAIQHEEYLNVQGESATDRDELYSDLFCTADTAHQLPLTDTDMAVVCCYDALYYLYVQDYILAKEQAEEAIKLDPNNADACFNMALTTYHLAEDGADDVQNEIEDWLIKAVKLDPKMLEDDFVLDMLDEETIRELSGNTEKTAQKLLDRIKDLDDEGEGRDLDEIEDLCRLLIALKPKDNELVSTAYSYLSYVLEKQERYEEALDAAIEAVQLDPKDATNASNMAYALNDLDPEDPGIQAWLCKAVSLDKELILDEFVWEKLHIDEFLSRAESMKKADEKTKVAASPWLLPMMAMLGAGMAQLGKTDPVVKQETLQSEIAQ